MHRLTNDRMRWGCWAVVAGAALFGFRQSVLPYLWIRLPGAVVAVDGRPAFGPALYRGADGHLLLLDAPSPGETYVIDPKDHDVGLARRTDFLACGALAVSIEPVKVIDLTDPVKLDGHPQLVFRPGGVGFSVSETPTRSCRVRVTF